MSEALKRLRFTPGPWIVEGDSNVVMSERGELAICWLPSPSRPIDKRVIKNDARLIAAAPDLYAALASLVDRMESVRDVALGNALAEDYAALTQARAALAKADGR